MDLGIIGGADGPTAILVSTTTEMWMLLGACAVALVIGAVHWIIHIKRNKRNGG